VTIEHEAPIALGDKLEIIAHVHPAGSTDKFGPGLAHVDVLSHRRRPICLNAMTHALLCRLSSGGDS
jgi:acyl-ACP thioesterase